VLRRRLHDQFAVDQRIGIRRYHQAAARHCGELGDSGIDLGFGADASDCQLDRILPRIGLESGQKLIVISRHLRIEDEADARYCGSNLSEQFQRLSKHCVFDEGKAGNIPAGTRQARNEALPDRAPVGPDGIAERV
jgi:hypothetical protein